MPSAHQQLDRTLIMLEKNQAKQLSVRHKLVCPVCACLDLSVSSSGLGRAAVCDCGTPWTFLLPFFCLSVLFIPSHTLVLGYYPHPVCPPSVSTWFPLFNLNSFWWILFKLYLHMQIRDWRLWAVNGIILSTLSAFRKIIWVNINRFLPNLVYVLILLRSGLGFLIGKFRQFLTELSARRMIVAECDRFSFSFLVITQTTKFV